MQASRDEASAATRPTGSWKLRLVSVLVMLHLAAVILAPFRFATSSPEGTSPVAQISDWFRPYIEFAFLSHGYAFFAPDPGPSFLLRCRLEFNDGRPETVLTFPDRRIEYPRLLYHRHFMLSEQLNAMFIPSDPPPDLRDPMLLAQWRSDRARYEARRHSFEEHLKAAYGASRVTIDRVAHRQPTVQERLRGMSLTDPSLYRAESERGSPDGMGAEQGTSSEEPQP